MMTAHKKPAPFAQDPDNVLTVGTPGLDNLAQSFAAGSTIVFGNNMVNSLRFAFNRTAIDRSSPAWFSPDDLGSKFYSYQPGEMVLTIPGGFNIAAGTATTGRFNTNTYQMSDDLSLVRGNHQLAFGANVAYWKMDFLTHARSGGDWNVNGQVTGLGLADFMLGRVARLEHGGPATMPMHMLYLGFYTQDTWRATSQLTLNAGLRWEPFLGQELENAQVYNWVPENFRSNTRSTVFVNAPAGFIYPGDAGFPSGNTGLNKQWLNFSPRVGLAWDVSGDGRTAVRSSYGIAYDFPTAERHNINTQSPPWGNRSLVENPPGGFDDPYGHIGGNPHPITAEPGSAVHSLRRVWRDRSRHQLAADPVVERDRRAADRRRTGAWPQAIWAATRIGSGCRSSSTRPCSWAPGRARSTALRSPCAARRPMSTSVGGSRCQDENPASAALIGNLDLHTSIGEQNYRGLRLSVRRRSANGISLNANYTISRCFGDNTTGGFPQLAQGPTNPDDPDADRGHCDQDRTHLGNLNLGYTTPEVGNAVLRAIASNWRLSGIFNARSGSWLSVTTGSDRTLNGQRFQEQRVNKVSDDVYGDNAGHLLEARRICAAGARHVRRSRAKQHHRPGVLDDRSGALEAIAFGAAQNLELRIEAFNLFNHFNWGNPGMNFNAGTFGRFRRTRATRESCSSA